LKIQAPETSHRTLLQETDTVEVQSAGTGVIKQRASRTSFSKDVDGTMVYGLESISCRQCNRDMSCDNCVLKVKEIRNEFKWIYITRLLYIKTKSKSKESESKGLASVLSRIGELAMHTVRFGMHCPCTSPTLKLENNRSAARCGNDTPDPHPGDEVSDDLDNEGLGHSNEDANHAP
jgi:hypothetical protein